VILGICVSASAYDEVVIFPQEKGVQINRFFYDFKSPAAPKKFMGKGWAETLLTEYGFTGIRTSIYGTGQKPAHPEPGVVLEEYYEPETQALKLAKKIKPDVIIFASKKLDNVDSFPVWTKNGSGVIPEKYAILLADYLDYMKREGLEVDVLGIDNERRFNEGNIMPETHRDIVLALRRLTKDRGLKMPKIIGHEDYAMGRNNWMATFVELESDTMDIFGGHYYTRARILDKLKSDLAYAGDREKWHSELHWDNHGDPKGSVHSMETAVCSFLALWDCVDNGMNGLMWWDFNPKKKRRDYLMHAASVPLVNAWPIKVIDPDGSETVDLNQLHTRAFLQGDVVTVYAINYDSSKKWKDLRFRLATGSIASKIEGSQWADGHGDKGRTGVIKPYTCGSFRVDLAPGTINVFSFKVIL
jgi:O-glycosyl hydrolase